MRITTTTGSVYRLDSRELSVGELSDNEIHRRIGELTAEIRRRKVTRSKQYETEELALLCFELEDLESELEDRERVRRSCW